jgi:hypothetical protein
MNNNLDNYRKARRELKDLEDSLILAVIEALGVEFRLVTPYIILEVSKRFHFMVCLNDVNISSITIEVWRYAQDEKGVLAGGHNIAVLDLVDPETSVEKIVEIIKNHEYN